MSELFQEEDITIINIYASNISTPQYIREMLTDINGKTESTTIIFRDFNASLTEMIILIEN